MTIEVQEESPALQEAKIARKQEKDKLTAYIMKSARHRVKLIKNGEYLEGIRAEIAISTAYGRFDLVKNLLGRLERLLALEEEAARLEAIDYEERFGEDLPVSPSYT